MARNQANPGPLTSPSARAFAAEVRSKTRVPPDVFSPVKTLGGSLSVAGTFVAAVEIIAICRAAHVT